MTPRRSYYGLELITDLVDRIFVKLKSNIDTKLGAFRFLSKVSFPDKDIVSFPDTCGHRLIFPLGFMIA